MKNEKTFKVGDLVLFNAYEYGFTEKEGEWFCIIVRPYNLLKNADINAQLNGEYYKRIPYFFLRHATDKY